MSEGEDKVAVSGESKKSPFQRTFESPPREVVSSEGDIGQREAENGEVQDDEVLENAVRDARQETLRVLLDKLKQVSRKILGKQFLLKERQFSPEEVEVFEKALDRAVGALGFKASLVDDATSCSSVELTDEDLLARMREQSQGFAEMVRRGFEQMGRDAGL